MYESVKARLEAEEAAAQEEQRLVDLLRAEEVAARARQEAADRAAKQAQLRASMLADNRAQLQYKVQALVMLNPAALILHRRVAAVLVNAAPNSESPSQYAVLRARAIPRGTRMSYCLVLFHLFAMCLMTQVYCR